MLYLTCFYSSFSWFTWWIGRNVVPFSLFLSDLVDNGCIFCPLCWFEMNHLHYLMLPVLDSVWLVPFNSAHLSLERGYSLHDFVIISFLNWKNSLSFYVHILPFLAVLKIFSSRGVLHCFYVIQNLVCHDVRKENQKKY